MAKELIVSATSLEKKVAILEDDQVTEIFIEREESRSILGNVYKGRVTRVLPGMQAAFVDIGLDRNAFLYVTDFFEDLEDFDDILKASGTVPDSFLIEENGEEPSVRRNRRSRRGRRNGSREWDEEKDAAGRGESGLTEVVEPEGGRPERREGSASISGLPLPPAHHRARVATLRPADLQAQRILPEFLGGPVAPADEGRPEYPAPPLILPDQLSTPGQEANSAGGTPPRRQARAGTQPDIQNLAVSRGSTSTRSRRRNAQSGVGPLIGDLLKEGQEILVQVAKEPIGRKGARITSHIVFPGRFLVFMPTVNHVGVSRRIESPRERQRLRDLLVELRGEIEKGFIVRTAGEGRSREEMRQDMVYLTRVWESIRQKAEKATAPALIHSELDLVQRVIRDFLTEEYQAIRVDDEDEYARIVEFITNFNPEMVRRVRLFTKKTPIFDEFNVTAEVEQALKSKVWLKNGGYIVINQTEALVAIDVNTGKYVGRTNSLEDTIARTNLDAVREVVRQIRLRDLGGIIIVDFIDMNEPKNQQRVLDALQNELRKDKSPSKVLPFNDFGLVAITRKRVKQSLERVLCQPCLTCEGTGMTKSVRTICYTIHDAVRRALPSLGEGRELIIRCHPDVAQHLRETEQRVVKELREITGKVVTILTDPVKHIEQFDLVEV